MAKDCPHCGLLSPREATRCDCGHDFETGQIKRTYRVSGPVPKAKAAGIGLAGAVLVYLLIRLLFMALGR